MDYQDKRILVLGGLGFIGLNLVQALLKLGAKVTILGRSCPPLALRWLNNIVASDSVTLLQGDLRDSDYYSNHLVTQDVIFNLAGQSGAARSLIQAHIDMQSNIEGNLMLLEAVRQCNNPPRIVFVSSRLVYGQTGGKPVEEHHPLQPTSIYGLHKLAVEHYYRLYNMHHGIPYTVMRLTNPYGPYQMPDRRGYGVVNQFMILAVRNENVVIYGDGQQLRDYIDIRDVVRALLCMGLHPDAVGETFNIAYGKSIKLAAAAEMIVCLAGHGSINYVPWPEADKQVETGDFHCEIRHARQVLDWEPFYDWKSGFTKTLNLYRRLLE